MALENRTALIIEDDAHSLLALGSLLDRLAIGYRRNTTGAHVVEQARRLRPDVILLDMNLPDGDSIAICAAIQKDPALGSVPVIAMADKAIIDDLLPVIRQANFAGHIAKPFEQHELADLLRRLLPGD